MEFFKGLIELLFSQQGTITDNQELLLAIFSAGCAAMGIIVVVLDALLFYGMGQSALNLTYRRWSIVFFLLFWGVGAGLGGFLGASAQIFQINRVACLTAGIAWPLILPRLIQATKISEDTQE